VSANVLPFSPHSAETQTHIPTPFFYRPGDNYFRVDVTDSSLLRAGLYPGSTSIFREGFRMDGTPHLCWLDDELTVWRVTRLGDGRVKLGLAPNPVSIRRESELTTIGSLVEFYPTGLKGPRYITFQPDRAHLFRSSDNSIFNACADNVAFAT
jgi:hypothetical protein